MMLLGRWYIYTVHVNVCVSVRGRPGQSWDKRRLEESGWIGWQYACVTTGILQIRWTDDGDRDVAALATMYIAEVPNESSVSQRSFHRMS